MSTNMVVVGIQIILDSLTKESMKTVNEDHIVVFTNNFTTINILKEWSESMGFEFKSFDKLKRMSMVKHYEITGPKVAMLAKLKFDFEEFKGD